MHRVRVYGDCCTVDEEVEYPDVTYWISLRRKVPFLVCSLLVDAPRISGFNRGNGLRLTPIAAAGDNHMRNADVSPCRNPFSFGEDTISACLMRQRCCAQCRSISRAENQHQFVHCQFRDELDSKCLQLACTGDSPHLPKATESNIQSQSSTKY